MDKAKPFDIPKREVWEAFKRVKANQGAAGVDGQSIAEFEANLSGNLYKLWNRMSSGSYLPPPVRRVDIPKANGGTRPLGIPTVADRIAQEVARRYLEPDSGAAVPRQLLWLQARQICHRCRAHGSAALLALRLGARSRCSELLRQHRLGADAQGGPASYGLPWVLLYIERWLKAPVQMEDGSIVPRTAGTPQGGVISPCWRTCSCTTRSTCGWRGPIRTSRSSGTRTMPFVTAKAPRRRRRYGRHWRIAWRPASWSLHPEKTKIVYCKDVNRRGDYPNQSFDFLGFTFRARKTVWHGHLYAHGFRPAVSSKALKAISRTIRRWALHHRSDKSLQDLAAIYNPYITRLDQLLRPVLSKAAATDAAAYRHLPDPLGALEVQAPARRPKGAREWLARVRRANPTLFSHWRFFNVGSRTSEAV